MTSTALTPAQLEFLSEDEFVTIVPNFSQIPLQLISLSVSPYQKGSTLTLCFCRLLCRRFDPLCLCKCRYGLHFTCAYKTNVEFTHQTG